MHTDPNHSGSALMVRSSPKALFFSASVWNEAFYEVLEDTEMHSITLKTCLFGDVNQLEHCLVIFNRHMLFSVNSFARLKAPREINKIRSSSMNLTPKCEIDLYKTVKEVKQGQDRPSGNREEGHT